MFVRPAITLGTNLNKILTQYQEKCHGFRNNFIKMQSKLMANRIWTSSYFENLIPRSINTDLDKTNPETRFTHAKFTSLPHLPQLVILFLYIYFYWALGYKCSLTYKNLNFFKLVAFIKLKLICCVLYLKILILFIKFSMVINLISLIFSSFASGLKFQL